MPVILLIIILGALIFVHELGHFLIAKKNGIRVDEFAIGFPPTLFSKTVGETKYSLNAIPFGGFVRIFGENPDAQSLDKEATNSFQNKSKLVQASVLVGGVVFNLIFAWFLFTIALSVGTTQIIDDEDISEFQNSSVLISGVFPDSPASEAGIKPGDIILGIQVREDFFAEPSISDIPQIIKEADDTLTILILRRGQKVEVDVVPEIGVVGDHASIGISMDISRIVKEPFHVAIYKALIDVFRIIKVVFVGLITLITGNANMSQVAGPVGIISLVGNAAQFGFVNLINFTAVLSINLAVLNILPIPALDGGRLLFLAYESITRKKIKPKLVNFLNTSFFLILIGLMVLITYSDIFKLVR